MGYSISLTPYARRLLFAAAAAVFLVCSGLSVPGAHAAWGEFTIKDEVELGKKIKASVRSSLPIVDDPEVQEYVNGLLNRILASAPPQPFDFSISVIRHNAINAFATPGGNLFVFTGLILAMEHESEVAGVLAHEIAHATQRHIAGRIAQMQKISLLSLAGALIGGFLGGDAGSAVAVGSLAAGQSAQLKYSRADETDADHVGMGYFTKAGYPPQGMVGAFEKIRRQQWFLGSSIPTYLSTHPAIQDRIQSMNVRIQSLPANLRNRKDDDTKFKRIQALIRARFSDTDQALAAFNKQVREKGASRCLALMGQGIVYSRTNRINDAENIFEEALTCAPGEPLIAREAGIFHYQRGSRDKAGILLTKAMTLNSRDHVARFYYARLLADGGNLRGAQEEYKRILLDLPDDPEVHVFYAQALGADKQLFKAYLHMAYGSLYANDKKKTQQNYDRAKSAAKTPQDEAELKRLGDAFKERTELFEGK
ncbi:Peptidase M48 family protein [uncultured delta proteobacterium]|uniref:Peptidase M48 family protein n=1 Tax=uncultured delta proteobacterium TaxID=34034 RepID=A0A212J5G3_9DELT|nr:Peptidase M48 family protein [uncultured delta proteobacterium]